MTARSLRIGLGLGPKTLRITRGFVNVLGIPVGLRASTATARGLVVSMATVPVTGQSLNLTFTGSGAPAAPANVVMFNQGGPVNDANSNPGASSSSTLGTCCDPVSGATSYKWYRSDDGFTTAIATGIVPTTFQGYISNGTSGTPGNILTVTTGPTNGQKVYPGMRYTSPGILQETMVGKQASGTSGGAGTYPVTRSQALGTSGSPVTFTGVQYVDTTATNAVRAATDGPATAYWYKITAVNAFGESAKSTNMIMWSYRNGMSQTGNSDLSSIGPGASQNYASTNGSPVGGPFDIELVLNASIWQPTMDVPQTPQWTGEIGWANYIIIDFRATSVSSNLQFGTVSRLPAPYGDAYGWSPAKDPYSTSYGPTVTANTWSTRKIPLADLAMGYTTFQGSLTGATLTVPSQTLQGLGVIDMGGFITGPGIPTGTYLIPNGNGQNASIGTFQVAGPGIPVTGTVSSTGQNWHWQRTSMYKYAINPTNQPYTIYVNNAGFSVT